MFHVDLWMILGLFFCRKPRHFVGGEFLSPSGTIWLDCLLGWDKCVNCLHVICDNKMWEIKLPS